MSQSITIDLLNDELQVAKKTSSSFSAAIDQVLGAHAIDASEWTPLANILLRRNGFDPDAKSTAPSKTSQVRESELADWTGIALRYNASFGEASTNAFNHFNIPFGERASLRKKIGQINGVRGHRRKATLKTQKGIAAHHVGSLF